MINFIKKWFKGCEHRWIVQSNFGEGKLDCWFQIIKFCSICGKKDFLRTDVGFELFEGMNEARTETLKAIKTQNPDYYVIGIDK